ncbi:hypothetical protein BXP70_26770 [Hymenobacter crusticola]|uniref:DUF2975 domain-containing protein n=1 Tax=Hymenobacter crusticola TaxID=1770526 RepID=A0A243W6B6_9BACT|nr:hypothetical protein BXP70_26770 [Hymenobacter crusticola]
MQYVLSAVGVVFMLAFSLYDLNTPHDLAFVTLQRTAAAHGQLGGGQADLLLASHRPGLHYFVAKSNQQRLIYREPNVAKRLVLNLLGVNNSSLSRSSLALALFSMLTGRMLFHMLRDLRLDTPFTELNARRIRGLALLMIGIDVYEYLALNALRILVPAFPLGDGTGTVTPYIILDPSLGGFGSWKFGLVLLVIAAIYQRGVQMAREAELTI